MVPVWCQNDACMHACVACFDYSGSQYRRRTTELHYSILTRFIACESAASSFRRKPLNYAVHHGHAISMRSTTVSFSATKRKADRLPVSKTSAMKHNNRLSVRIHTFCYFVQARWCFWLKSPLRNCQPRNLASLPALALRSDFFVIYTLVTSGDMLLFPCHIDGQEKRNCNAACADRAHTTFQCIFGLTWTAFS